MIAGYVMGSRAAARASAMGVVSDHIRGPLSADAIGSLEERLDRMVVVIEAMWSLLQEHGYTDEQLATRIREIDEADGTADGRRTLAPVTCPGCEAKVAPGLARCQICGTETGITPGPLHGI
jgi:hypothetical protein